METAENLKRLWPFSEMDTNQAAALTNCARRRRYDSGRSIFQEGDPAHSLYLVLSGAVHLQRELEDGTPYYLSRYRPVEVVDEAALPDGKPRANTAMTIGPCEVLVVDGSAFQRCLELFFCF